LLVGKLRATWSRRRRPPRTYDQDMGQQSRHGDVPNELLGTPTDEVELELGHDK